MMNKRQALNVKPNTIFVCRLFVGNIFFIVKPEQLIMNNGKYFNLIE